MKQIWPILILWLAFGLRLYHLDTQSIWWDEGHSIFVAQHALIDIPTLPAMDVHPPAYFWLLHGWLNIAGQREFALRYLSVIFSLLTVPLLMGLASHLQNFKKLAEEATFHRPARSSLLVALMAALSPMYVAYAQEVRSYAMLTCLATASTWALWQSLHAPRFNRTWLAYIGLTAACLYTHYFSVFLILFHNIVGLSWVIGKTLKTIAMKLSQRVRPKGFVFNPLGQATNTFPFDPKGSKSEPFGSKPSRLMMWLSSQIAILLLFAPQLRLAARQVTDYANPNLQPPTLSDFLTRSWQAYTMGLTIDPLMASKGMGLLAGLLLLSWLVGLGENRRATLFLTAWLVIPLSAYFIVLQNRPSFEPRYLMLITPAIFLLWAIIPSRHGAGIALLLTTIPFSYGLHSYYTNETYFKDDSAGVTHWLASETTPRDVVFVDVPHPFHYYAAQIPAPTRYLFVDIHTAAETLTRETQGHERLFWVTWSGSDTDPRGVIPFLAEKQGQKLGQQDFKGYHVQWFSVSGQPFSLPSDLPPIEATFGDSLRLDGAAFGFGANQRAWATLHFSLLNVTPINYKVSLRLRAMSGETVAQVDQDLLNDRHFRTSAWPLNDNALNQAINVYLLPFVPSGTYRLEVVVYNAAPPHPSEGVFGAAASPDNSTAILGEIK